MLFYSCLTQDKKFAQVAVNIDITCIFTEGDGDVNGKVKWDVMLWIWVSAHITLHKRGKGKIPNSFVNRPFEYVNLVTY